MTKHLGKKIIIGSLIFGGLAGLTGCFHNYSPEDVKYLKSNKETRGYFSDKGVIAKYPAFGSTDKVDSAVGDMDGDDRLDLLLAESGKVRYFENSGDGYFYDKGVIAKYP